MNFKGICMLKRRDLLKTVPAIVAMPYLLRSSRVLAEEALEDAFKLPNFAEHKEAVRFWPENKAVPETGYVVPSLDDYAAKVKALTGADDPYPKEIELGRKLIEKDIPKSGVTPYDVAHRFYLWRRGEVGDTAKERDIYSAYAREWPVRGNPIIMGFFTEATGLRNPKGDTTYWCSAFVCWCIMRARTNAADANPVWPKQDGAASASYRSWAKKETAPKRGDIAVFQRTDVSWAGHVGFVDKVDGETIHVLGGNQGAQNDYNGGEVNIAEYSSWTKKNYEDAGKNLPALVFHSYRTSEFLHATV